MLTILLIVAAILLLAGGGRGYRRLGRRRVQNREREDPSIARERHRTS
jgi:hypothetical protein